MEILEEIYAYAKENHIPIVRDITKDYLIEEVKHSKPNSILEIGTAIGYSGSLMLLNSNAKLVTLEKNETSFEIAKSNFEKLGLTDRVEQILGDAMETLQELVKKGRTFDFIFLDGPKGQYFRYLQIIKHLVKSGSVIFADNVEYFGMVKSNVYPHRKKTIVVSLQNYLNEVENSPSFETKVYDIDDGFSITKVK